MQMTQSAIHDPANDNTYYDSRWKQESTLGGPPNELRISLVAKAALDRLAKQQSHTLLDVGCGIGWILARLEHLTDSNIKLCGVEPSAVGAQLARNRSPRSTIAQGLLGEASLDNTSFGVVTCSEVLEHVANQPEFVQLLASHIETGGSLVLTTPNGVFRDTYFGDMGVVPQPTENWIQADTLHTLLSTHFRKVTITTFDPSYWLSRHRIIGSIRTRISHLPFLWRSAVALDSVIARLQLGLYLCAIASDRK